MYIQLGRNIASARTQASVTQAQLADALGLSRTSITNVEAGKQTVQVDELLLIAHYLRTPVTDLLARTALPPTLPPCTFPRCTGSVQPWVNSGFCFTHDCELEWLRRIGSVEALVAFLRVAERI